MGFVYVTSVALTLYCALITSSILRKFSMKVLYTYHPLLGTLFLAFVAIGTLSAQLSKARSPGPNARRHYITRHGFWSMAASLSCCLCFAAIYINKELAGKPHFKAWHGFMGVIALVLCVSQTAAGALIGYFPGVANKLRPLAQMYALHRLSGYATLASVAAAHGLALYSGYTASRSTAEAWCKATAFTAVFAFLVMGSSTFNKPSVKQD